MLTLIKQWFSEMFLDLLGSFGGSDKHVWIEDAPLDREEEVHRDYYERSKELSERFENICRVLNFIYDDPHEGNGWWEKVRILKVHGLTGYELDKIADRDDQGRLWTYIPKLILEDIDGEVTGFNDPDSPVCHPTVWIHYHTEN